MSAPAATTLRHLLQAGLRRAAHAGLLFVLVGAGTLALIRYAPGYFSDVRELDGAYAATVRAELSDRRAEDSSASAMAEAALRRLLHGDLGTSRHYHVPVTTLLEPCVPVTASLISRALSLAWLAAFALALNASMLRSRLAQGSAAALGALGLAVPIGALATALLLLGWGASGSTAGLSAPVLTLAALLTVRDFLFFHRAFQASWTSPNLLYARAQGLPLARVLATHLLRPMLRACAAVLTLSFLAALSLAVPVEVLFDLPGLGQLAWTAATNRDTPVLLAVTLLLAGIVTAARALTPAAATERSSA